MTCAVCFFTDSFQKGLKRKAFGEPRFENKLKKFMQLFIGEIHGLQSFSTCSCDLVGKSENYIAWTDSLTEHWQNSVFIVEKCFNEIIDVYLEFVSTGTKKAGALLWNYIDSYDFHDLSENQLSLGQIFYRGRKADKWDESSPSEYFHIPFSLRHFVGNQRFSISGQPMVYLASSVVAARKELETDICDLRFAAFVPKKELFAGAKFFNLKNHYADLILNSMPEIIDSGARIRFDDRTFGGSLGTLESDIARTVLMHLCTYPVEKRGAFMAEYVIPQLLTTTVQENDYVGIVFPSTKDYSDVFEHHRFSRHHINLGVFVPYDAVNDISLKLFEKFNIYLPSKFTTPATTQTFYDELDDVIKLNKNSRRTHEENQDFIPNILNKLQIEYRSSGFIDGKPYFDGPDGQFELNLASVVLADYKTKPV